MIRCTCTSGLSREPSLNRYKRGTPIGRGGQGQVYKYNHPTTREVLAVKVLEFQPKGTNRLNIILEALMSLHTNDEHVLRAHDIFIYNEGVAIVMPYHVSGDLAKIAPRLSISDLKEAIRQILSALQYLHEQGQIHRDIKPGNVLVRKEEPLDIVIADFGWVSISDPITNCGTPGYKAPEIHLACETSIPVPYGPPVDVYALGVLLLKCLNVELGDRAVLNEDIHFQIVARAISSEMAKSEDVERRGGLFLAERMLKFRPEDRPTVDQCLQHPWLDRWSYTPFITVPDGYKDFQTVEPETRPSNNPIQALAINMYLERFLGLKKRLPEYLADILRNGPGGSRAESPITDAEDEYRIAELLSRLPIPDITDVVPLGLITSDDATAVPRPYTIADRVPCCIAKYLMERLVNPANERTIKKLAKILFKTLKDGYLYPNTGDQAQPHRKMHQKSETGIRASRKPPRPTASPRMVTEAGEGLLSQVPRTHASADHPLLAHDQPDRPKGIQNRLRSSTAYQATINPNSDRMDICSQSRPNSRKSRGTESLAASDRMELCSQ